MDEEEKLKDNQPMQPTTASTLDFTNSEVQVCPDEYFMYEGELKYCMQSYVKVGDEVIGRFKNTTCTLYTKLIK